MQMVQVNVSVASNDVAILCFRSAILHISSPVHLPEPIARCFLYTDSQQDHQNEASSRSDREETCESQDILSSLCLLACNMELRFRRGSCLEGR